MTTSDVVAALTAERFTRIPTVDEKEAAIRRARLILAEGGPRATQRALAELEAVLTRQGVIR